MEESEVREGQLARNGVLKPRGVSDTVRTTETIVTHNPVAHRKLDSVYEFYHRYGLDLLSQVWLEDSLNRVDSAWEFSNFPVVRNGDTLDSPARLLIRHLNGDMLPIDQEEHRVGEILQSRKYYYEFWDPKK